MAADPSCNPSPDHQATDLNLLSPIPGPSSNCGALLLSSTPMNPTNTDSPPTGKGTVDLRFQEDDQDPNIDIVAMDIEKRSGEPLPTPTRYDLIMRQLSQALNDPEVELTGRPQGERSTIQTYTLPASHQEATDNETPDDPVPDQFEVADFLPDVDRLMAPLGDLAAVPDNEVLRFVLVKRKTMALSSPWSIPDCSEFDQLINTATIRALSEDCLTPFAWADPKRGNIALYATSRMGMERFREVIRSISPPDDEFQYETYLRESVVQKLSLIHI